MDDEFGANVAGALLYGAIYTVAVLIVGLIWSADLAVLCAIASAGCAYLCFLTQISLPGARWISGAFVILSAVFGILAGIFLILSHTHTSA